MILVNELILYLMTSYLIMQCFFSFCFLIRIKYTVLLFKTMNKLFCLEINYSSNTHSPMYNACDLRFLPSPTFPPSVQLTSQLATHPTSNRSILQSIHSTSSPFIHQSNHPSNIQPCVQQAFQTSIYPSI